MKKKLFPITLFLLVLFSACVPKDVCRITIHAENYPNDNIRLVWYDHGTMREDTVRLEDGVGTTDIKALEWTELILVNSDNSKSITVDNGAIPAPHFQFFVENGKHVNITFDNNQWPAITLSGGKLNNSYNSLWKETGILEGKIFALHRELLSTNDTSIQQIKNKGLIVLREEMEEKEKNFIQSHPDSYISLYLLQAYAAYMPILEYESKFLSLDTSVQHTEKGKGMYEHILKIKRSSPGQPAPGFIKKDKDGHTITLSDFLGKYVLLDFWGTWCGPCRKSHPHLVALYKKYAPRGVEFINIAHEWDKNPRENWLKAIDEDQLTWTQILNNEEQTQCDVVDLYGIQAFPTKILIDKDGKILAKGSSDEIDNELRKIFGI